MFETLARDLETRFGLGAQSSSFLRMLMAHMTDPDRGGLGAFVGQLRDAQWGVDRWLGNESAATAVTTDQIERAFGGAGGLVGQMMSRLNLTREKVVSALAFAIPALVARLTPGGALPATLPPPAVTYIGDRREWVSGPAAVTTSTVAPAVVEKKGMGWLPWVLAAIVAAGLLTLCSKRSATTPVAPAEPASVPAAEPVASEPVVPVAPVTPVTPAVVASEPAVAGSEATVPAPSGGTPSASAQASEEPAGAGVLAWRLEDRPALKVYFDTGSATVSPEIATAGKELVDFMAADSSVKAAISGFNDPTGDPVKNAELSKNRAEAVRAALVGLGIAADRLELRKPAETTGTAATNAASRRVEVTLYK